MSVIPGSGRILYVRYEAGFPEKGEESRTRLDELIKSSEKWR